MVLISVAAYSQLASVIGSLHIVGGIIACGVFLLLVSIIGIIGAVHHHQIALFFYMIIIFLIFLIQFSVAIACLAVTAEQQHKLLAELWHQASDATKEEAQYQLSCCGFDNKTIVDAGLSQPKCQMAACCLNNNHPCCTGSNLYSTTENPQQQQQTPVPQSTEPCPCDPCYSKFYSRTSQAFRLTGGLGLFFSFLEVCPFSLFTFKKSS